MKTVHIASHRLIGGRCQNWAEDNLPPGWKLSSQPESDVFISVMYDELVSERFINERPCYNFHPGLLPHYRGSGAFSWAIINRELETGVTLHKLDVNIDTGPVISKTPIPIWPTDTAETLYNRAMEVMFLMFQEYFGDLLEGNYFRLYPQERSAGKTYYRRDLKEALDLTRFVRAFTFEGKPGAYYTNSQGEKIELRW